MYMQRTASGAAGNGLYTTAAGISPGTTAMHMQRTTSGTAGNGLYTTIKCMLGAAGIGLGTTIKHLRRATSGTAGNGLGATMKYLRRTTSAAANKGLSTTIIPPCSAASFEEKLRALRRGTSLGPFVCRARACSLCSFMNSLVCGIWFI
jgi:hypothetical protein